MSGVLSSSLNPVYDILMADADGRHLWLECLQDLGVAKQRLKILSTQFPGVRLVLCNHQTRAVLAETDGY